ncbi:hypothetical protein FACS189443_3630 [Planctomycetales bacterium]|nr:hypothetical protein FACS189443_3630 [Planctomycetales bacterium]
MQIFFRKKMVFVLILMLLFFSQTCHRGQGQDTTARESEEYKRLVKEYRDSIRRHAELLKKAKTDDPSFERAMDWLEKEQLKVSTPFGQEDRDFFSTLQDDDKKRYRDWQRGLTAKISIDVFENEWKKYPHSHNPLLFWAGVILKKFSSGRQESDTEDNSVPQMTGAEDSQWSNFLAYTKRRSAALMEQSSRLAEELHIKKEMIGHFEKKVANTALFNVYDTYYRLHFPEELKSVEKEQKALRRQLTELNPNWATDENFSTNVKRSL